MFVVNIYTPFVIRLIRIMNVDRGFSIMKSRRSRLEIHLDVLNVIKEGTTIPTRIMYGANLSWKLLQSILNKLVKQDLVEEIDVSGNHSKRTIYRVTPKGDRVIRYFDNASELTTSDEPSFNPLQIVK